VVQQTYYSALEGGQQLPVSCQRCQQAGAEGSHLIQLGQQAVAGSQAPWAGSSSWVFLAKGALNGVLKVVGECGNGAGESAGCKS